MKLLLVYPDIRTHQFPHFQHGLAWISALVKKEGHEVDLIYLNREITDEEFIEKVRRIDPDVVGFSATSQQFNFAKRYAKAVKDSLGKFLVLGGVHATTEPEGSMADNIFDVVVRSEGEYPVLELLEALRMGRDFSQIPNLWVSLKNGDIKRNPIRPPVDLAALPWPDREIFDNDALMKFNDGQVSVMASRGCPYRCAHCCNSALMEMAGSPGSWVRQRPVPDVIGELEYLHKRFPDLKSLIFMDEIFTLKKSWIKDFCNEYRARFRAPFLVFIRVETVTREMLEWMRQAGLSWVLVGVESGNEDIRRRVLNRKMSNDKIIQVFKWADELGVKTWSLNMIGVPDDTEATIRETMELNRIIRPDHLQISIFYPYPGTPLYERCKKENLVQVNENTSYWDAWPVLDLPGLPREKLHSLFKEFRTLGYQLEAEKGAMGYADLTALLPNAEIDQGGEDYVALWLVRIEGQERISLLMHPTSRASYDLQIQPQTVLRFGIAFSPDVWDKPGGGVTFEIKVKSRFKREKTIFSEFIDPKHNEDQQRWLDREVDLSDFGGKTVTLTLLTSTPPGQNQYCPVFWSRPHLTKV